MDDIRIYYPLRRLHREVRLLQVEPERDGKVSLSLNTYALDTQPGYIALSYCWTKEPPTCEILLEGRPFWVRSNLHEYLKVLTEERESSLVFIDALCINQADEDEKADQIRFMRHIYRGAREVVAWMGAGSTYGAIIDPKLPELEAMCSSELDSADLRTLCEEYSKTEVKRAFSIAFLNYAYWSRLWIMQETILAGLLVVRFRRLRLPAGILEDIIDSMGFQTRSDVLDGSPIMKASLSFQEQMSSLEGGKQRSIFLRKRRLTELEERVFSSQANLCSLTISSLLIYRNRLDHEVHGGTAMTIAHAIELSAAQECSRPHDKIFGILALTESVLTPSYYISLTELYIQLLIEALLEFKAKFGNETHSGNRGRGHPASDERNLYNFIEAFLFKMELSPLHLTTGIIVIYALGICDIQLSPTVWLSEASRSAKSMEDKARFKAMPLLLHWCFMRDRHMSVPGDKEEITIEEDTRHEFRFSQWVRHIQEETRNIKEKLQAQRGLEIGSLNHGFSIRGLKI